MKKISFWVYIFTIGFFRASFADTDVAEPVTGQSEFYFSLGFRSSPSLLQLRDHLTNKLEDFSYSSENIQLGVSYLDFISRLAESDSIETKEDVVFILQMLEEIREVGEISNWRRTDLYDSSAPDRVLIRVLESVASRLSLSAAEVVTLVRETPYMISDNESFVSFLILLSAPKNRAEFVKMKILIESLGRFYQLKHYGPAIAKHYKLLRPAIRELRFFELIELNRSNLPVEIKLDIARMSAAKAELPHELELCFDPFKYVLEPLPPVMEGNAAGFMAETIAFGFSSYPAGPFISPTIGVSREERDRMVRERELVRRRIRHLVDRFYPRVAEMDELEYGGRIGENLRKLGGSRWGEWMQSLCARVLAETAEALKHETLYPPSVF